MKKSGCLLLLLPVLLFSSCEKEEEIPDGKVRVSVGVSVYGAFRNLTDGHGRPFFEGRMPGDFRVRVAAFLYRKSTGEADSLTDRKVVFLDNPQDDAHFQLESRPGEFVVLATADIVQLKDGELLANYNDVVINLYKPQIEIRFKNYAGAYNAAGFSASQKFGVPESGGRMQVKLQAIPTGSLVNLSFRGIDSGKGDRYTLPGLYRHLITGSPDGNALRIDISREQAGAPIPAHSPDNRYDIQWYLVTPDDSATLRWGTGDDLNHSGRFGFTPGKSKNVRIDLPDGLLEASDPPTPVTR